MPLSASIFRRGGPKKELFDVINEDVDDEKELDEKLAELDELLHMNKSGRELSAALWRPALCAAELVKQRKQSARDMGFIRGRRIYLHVEEAVFLLDRGDLLMFIEEEVEQLAGPAGSSGLVNGKAAEGAVAAGGRRKQRQRLLSVQEAFDLMISVGVPLERYLLYCSLSRSGYLVMRHPSRWLLGREEHPEQVWGSGAWAACYGRHPAVPGTVAPQPMQQRLAVAGAGAGAWPGTAAAAAAVATSPQLPAAAEAEISAAGQGTADDDVASTMEVDVSPRCTAQRAAGVVVCGADGSGLTGGADASGPSSPAAGGSAGAGEAGRVVGVQPAVVSRAPQQQSLRLHGQQGGSRRWQQGGQQQTAAAGGDAAGCRGWWQAAGPEHPHLAGVPDSFFSEMTQAAVEDRLSVSLLASFPNLRPFPTIQSTLAEAAGPAAPAQAAHDATHNKVAAAVAAAAAAAAATAAAETVSAAETATPAATGSVVTLGTPGDCAHLVFDVYKPGSFVSRYKAQFPAVHTHVAMCSPAPPSLAEMHVADAAAAAASGGEGKRPAGVAWAAVLNGDIALYGIGEANLLSLI